MRSYIVATEWLSEDTDAAAPVLTEDVAHPETTLVENLKDIVFKLRAFMESSGGEYALGIETGMQRAADMIENAIRRHDRGE